MIRKLIVPFFVLFLTSTFLHADQTSDAKIVLSKYLEAQKVFDTTVMSDLMHPEALEQFKNVISDAFNGSKSDLAKSEILPLFKVGTVEDYRKLSSKEAYKRFFDFVASAQPELRKLMNASNFSIVNENLNNDIAYMTCLMTLNINGQTINKNVVQKLKLNNGNWMLLLAEDAEASIAGIAFRYK
ncbi:hypothetical protein [Paraglaciecola sp.]|uniref:hypothetical protein n=1 Tax=Paraglaciecola sp. TaxID=1920173 RepID=UPI0030F4460B